MDPQQIETLSTFLGQVDQENLFQYLGLSIDATDDEAHAAIKKRRSWAQGQQSNPKYRSEAIWYIKNISLLKQILLEDRAAYIHHLRLEKHRSALRTLSVYILGALAGGVLSSRAEGAIRERGEKLGLPSALVSQQIDRLLQDQGARREEGAPAPATPLPMGTADPDAPTASDPNDLFEPETDPGVIKKSASGEDEGPPDSSGHAGGLIDLYAVLGVQSVATPKELEAAYRARYRQVGRMNSPPRARLLYAELDEAWKQLQDQQRRLQYDTERRRLLKSRGIKPSLNETEFGRTTPADLIEDGVTSEAPKLPDGLAKRTYKPGASKARAPKLEVDSPEEIKLSIGRSEHRLPLTVRNTGAGRMSGRVHADRPWITPTPARLDPLLKEQIIELVIDPGEMPRRRGQCRVTISTRTGGNRSVMLLVERSGRILPFLFVIGTLLVAGAAVFPFFSELPTEVSPGIGRLVLNVDPPVGEIYINDTLINTQGALDTEAGFPLNTPFEIKIQANGFAEWTETTTVPSEDTITLNAALELTDPMNFAPKDDWVQGGLNEDALQAELLAHEAALMSCFTSSEIGAPGYTASLKVQGYINQLGAIARVDFLARNFDAPEVDHCLRRQFRGLSLPLLSPRFDYATFEQTIRYTVPTPQD